MHLWYTLQLPFDHLKTFSTTPSNQHQGSTAGIPLYLVNTLKTAAKLATVVTSTYC
uniref:Uncharacterized protein n=1 Tax=Rhizophora mucronata TaxID=61149 RepID=A0A2P2KKM2_RHIMU